MPKDVTNGASVATFLAAGVGAFAVGAFTLLNEAGWFVAPTLYGPAGGVSGRTTFAAASWLLAWGVLHHRWGGRQVEPGTAYMATIALTLAGVVGTFPPVWGLL